MQRTAALTRLCNELYRLTADPHGVTALEYAMIASVIATSIISIATSLGVDLTTVLRNVSSAL